LGTAEQKWKATPSHWFIKLLELKGKLLRLYTQNIDGLDFQLKLPQDKVISVHGTLGKIECENCKEEYPIEEFREKVRSNIKDIYNLPGEIAPTESTPIVCLNCGKPCVKPATVLYGSALPKQFFECIYDDDGDAEKIDLLFVVGTSLTVSPANSVVRVVSRDCKRVIVNNQMVGIELGIAVDNDRDFYLEGNCDDSILKLIHSLGWMDEFRALCPHQV
jgi:NAD-dependent SIR2 family protein deacetylase